MKPTFDERINTFPTKIRSRPSAAMRVSLHCCRERVPLRVPEGEQGPRGSLELWTSTVPETVETSVQLPPLLLLPL